MKKLIPKYLEEEIVPSPVELLLDELTGSQRLQQFDDHEVWNILHFVVLAAVVLF